jgi:hypothetical protein
LTWQRSRLALINGRVQAGGSSQVSIRQASYLRCSRYIHSFLKDRLPIFGEQLEQTTKCNGRSIGITRLFEPVSEPGVVQKITQIHARIELARVELGRSVKHCLVWARVMGTAVKSADSLTALKPVNKLKGDLVINAHQTRDGRLAEPKGGEVKRGFSAPGDCTVAIEGDDALEGDLLGHSMYGEVAGNLHAGLAGKGNHLGETVNLRGNEFSGWKLLCLKYPIANVAVPLILVTLEIAQVGGELRGADRNAAIGSDDEIAGNGRGGTLGVIGEVNPDKLLCH